MGILPETGNFLSPKPGSLTLILWLFSAILVMRAWQPKVTLNWPGTEHTSQSKASLAVVTILLFGLLDWMLLAALPLLRLSFGPLEPALAGITALRVFILLLLIILSIVRGTFLEHFPSGKNRAWRCSQRTLSLWLFNLGLLGLVFYALYIEPFNLQTTALSLAHSTLALDQPLRILHLSDLHVERITKRERELVQRIGSLQPDLILMTGDYLNIDYINDPITRHEGKWLLSQISAPYGVYAISGSPPVDTPDVMSTIFGGLDITVLHDEVHRLELPEGEIYLIGISNLGRSRDRDKLEELMSQISEKAFTVLLYHTPDLAETAAKEQVDLYLAGHTHGGQVRLPWWGALVTMSAYGKQYESGLHTLDQTTLYVSRGIGMEGLSLPRIRFLCSPEVVLITLEANGSP